MLLSIDMNAVWHQKIPEALKYWRGTRSGWHMEQDKVVVVSHELYAVS